MMSRRDISVETKEISRDEDMENLEQLAIAIEKLQTQLEMYVDERRLAWDRRLRAGDTTKAQLARASRCHPMNVTQGLKPDLVAKAKERLASK